MDDIKFRDYSNILLSGRCITHISMQICHVQKFVWFILEHLTNMVNYILPCDIIYYVYICLGQTQSGKTHFVKKLLMNAEHMFVTPPEVS